MAFLFPAQTEAGNISELPLSPHSPNSNGSSRQEKPPQLTALQNKWLTVDKGGVPQRHTAMVEVCKSIINPSRLLTAKAIPTSASGTTVNQKANWDTAPKSCLEQSWDSERTLDATKNQESRTRQTHLYRGRVSTCCSPYLHIPSSQARVAATSVLGFQASTSISLLI